MKIDKFKIGDTVYNTTRQSIYVLSPIDMLRFQDEEIELFNFGLCETCYYKSDDLTCHADIKRHKNSENFGCTIYMKNDI